MTQNGSVKQQIYEKAHSATADFVSGRSSDGTNSLIKGTQKIIQTKNHS